MAKKMVFNPITGSMTLADVEDTPEGVSGQTQPLVGQNVQQDVGLSVVGQPPATVAPAVRPQERVARAQAIPRTMSGYENVMSAVAAPVTGHLGLANDTMDLMSGRGGRKAAARRMLGSGLLNPVRTVGESTRMTKGLFGTLGKTARGEYNNR